MCRARRSVEAHSWTDLRGDAGEAVLIADATAPIKHLGSTEIQIYTSADSPHHQKEGCCVRLAWDNWLESESAVARYLLCFDGAGRAHALS